MNPVSKLLIGTGIFLIVAGLAWQFGGRFLSGLNLGRLPGDIAIEKENFRFYFPVATSILLSVVVSLVLWIVRRLSER